MAMRNPVRAYQQSQVQTASPGELTLMLYNGAIKFIKLSKEAIEKKNYADANHYNQRVQDILNELIITLNRSVPISNQFLQLYDFMLYRLREANIYKDVKMLDEVEWFFVEFRDTWKQAMLIVKQKGTP